MKHLYEVKGDKSMELKGSWESSILLLEKVNIITWNIDIIIWNISEPIN